MQKESRHFVSRHYFSRQIGIRRKNVAPQSTFSAFKTKAQKDSSKVKQKSDLIGSEFAGRRTPLMHIDF
jgi:hypothetical protein